MISPTVTVPVLISPSTVETGRRPGVNPPPPPPLCVVSSSVVSLSIASELHGLSSVTIVVPVIPKIVRDRYVTGPMKLFVCHVDAPRTADAKLSRLIKAAARIGLLKPCVVAAAISLKDTFTINVGIAIIEHARTTPPKVVPVTTETALIFLIVNYPMLIIISQTHRVAINFPDETINHLLWLSVSDLRLPR